MSSENVPSTCAKCADSRHPARAQSIILAYALRSYILWYPMIPSAGREGPDQTEWTAQSDLGFRCPYLPEDTFPHGEALYILIFLFDLLEKSNITLQKQLDIREKRNSTGSTRKCIR